MTDGANENNSDNDDTVITDISDVSDDITINIIDTQNCSLLCWPGGKPRIQGSSYCRTGKFNPCLTSDRVRAQYNVPISCQTRVKNLFHHIQVTLTSVRVTWAGLVTRKECADQFIVKSWLARNPNDYKMSDLLPTTQFSWVVKDLVPNQDYVFQVS